jgi:hypothetical protein
LNSGVYFVKVVTENGETVKRIIKQWVMSCEQLL